MRRGCQINNIIDFQYPVQRKTQMHYWYVKESEYEGEKYVNLFGFVPGHHELQDTSQAYSSPIIDMCLDETSEELLVIVEDDEINLRYFLHERNIEFYMECTKEIPLYIENIGDITYMPEPTVELYK